MAAPKSPAKTTSIIVTSTVSIFDSELDLTITAEVPTEVAKITDWLQYHIDSGILKIV